MILPPNCYLRRCAYYMGIAQKKGNEMDEYPVCAAFPKGIPEDIAYGDNLHLEPTKDQENKIVYKQA